MLRTAAISILVAVGLTFLVSAGNYTAPPVIADRVEEDWSVVIVDPDPDVTIPQITMMMAPDQGLKTPYLDFNLNYHDSPNYQPGGLQVRIRDGDNALAVSTQGTEQLNTAGETITWTQRMSLAGGSIHFKITSGTSSTWGAFGGGEGDLSASAATNLVSFENYSPDHSVEDSTPTFGANRLGSMTLLRVRYYQGTKLISTDETVRHVNLSK